MSKKKDGRYTGNPTVRARIKPADKESFEQACRKQGLEHSECVRLAIRQFVKKTEQQ